MDILHILIAHLIAVTFAYILDILFGDPRTSVHPVVLMGKLVSYGEKRYNSGSYLRIKGMLATVIPAIFIFIIMALLIILSYFVFTWVGILVEAVILWLFIGGKSMISHIESIYEKLQAGDMELARQETGMIVSRDTSELQEKDIVKAAVESIGENISDSVTAPFLYAVIGGAPLAAIYRFVNTADAMIGYRTERFKDYGFFAAKLDDLLNLAPARITALLMTTAVWKINKASWIEALSVTLKHARFHESPNAGYGEAAMAGVLHIKLGGPTMYNGTIRERPHFGFGDRLIDIGCLRDGLSVWRITIVNYLVLLWMVGGLCYVIFGL